jgi:HlyD family type I secretion membrane fusion protein
VAESSTKVVEHPDGGTVEEVLVQAGDRVDPGQLLMRLSTDEAAATVSALTKRLQALEARRARLLAERDGTETVDFPETLRRQARQDDSALRALEGEERQFADRRASIEGQVRIQRQRIAQLRRQIEGFQAQGAGVDRQIAIMGDELGGLRQLAEKGYYSRIRVMERERALAGMESQRGSIDAEIARAEEGIAEAEARIAQIRQQAREQSSLSLRETETAIDEIVERLTAATARLDRKFVLARFPGRVHAMAVSAPGAVVDPGDEILRIVPEGDTLVIDAQVSTTEIDRVREGLPAEVRFTAFSSRTTPLVTGTVTRVSADRLIDSASGRPYYEARITIPPETLADLPEADRITIGMPAEILIATGERTLVDYLVRPVRDAVSRGLIEE